MIEQITAVGKARQHLVNVLRRDPSLSMVKRWVLLDGATTDIGAPSNRLLPFVRFQSLPEKSEWHSNCGGISIRRCPWTLKIETVTNLADDYASIDLWERMHLALFPDDPTEAAAMLQRHYDAGISHLDPYEECWGEETKRIPETLMVASQGMLRVVQFVQWRTR